MKTRIEYNLGSTRTVIDEGERITMQNVCVVIHSPLGQWNYFHETVWYFARSEQGRKFIIKQAKESFKRELTKSI